MSAGTPPASIFSEATRLYVATMVPVQVWQFTAVSASGKFVASVPAVPGYVVPVAEPVQVIWSEVGAIDDPPEPVMAVPVTETEVPPVSALVERKPPESVAVFVQATKPENTPVTSQMMFVPAL